MTTEDFKQNIKWWESKRIFYNIAVGLFGLIALYDEISRDDFFWTFDDTLGILIWGIGANLFFFSDILLELFDWYYLNNKIGIKRFRYFFYLVGLSFSCFWTLFCGWLQFSKPYLW